MNTNDQTNDVVQKKQDFAKWLQSSENPDIYEWLLENLKVWVNNFLYDKVHSEMTIRQFQRVSITIYDLILQSYQSIQRRVDERNNKN